MVPAPLSPVQTRPMATQREKGDATQLAIDRAPFPVLTTVDAMRQWRQERMQRGIRVGFVPTMGALHAGHLSLVQQSLADNEETVVSIFVNPAQFAPTEDLSSYPRTLVDDLAALTQLKGPNGHRIGAIFAPSVEQMYPSPDGKPFQQQRSRQVGAFVEVQGLQERMEGQSRPHFFRGVATVVTKLFHVVQPTLAYFGQKDIQQAVILRRMVSDLLFAYPPGPDAVRIMPTQRDPHDGLALSSRNVYLTAKARPHATILIRALEAGQRAWQAQPGQVQATLAAAHAEAQKAIQVAQADGIEAELLYIDCNDPITLDDLAQATDGHEGQATRGAILSGACLIREGKEGKVTRLIDNLLLGVTF